MNRIYQGKLTNVGTAIGRKPGIDATKKFPGERFKRAWPPLIKVDESVKAKVEKLSSKPYQGASPLARTAAKVDSNREKPGENR